MKRRIKVDTYIHKQDADALEEFNRLDELGLANESDYPKSKKELKRTKINVDSIAFIQELTSTFPTETGIVLTSGIILMSPVAYDVIDKLIEDCYENSD